MNTIQGANTNNGKDHCVFDGVLCGWHVLEFAVTMSPMKMRSGQERMVLYAGIVSFCLAITLFETERTRTFPHGESDEEEWAAIKLFRRGISRCVREFVLFVYSQYHQSLAMNLVYLSLVEAQGLMIPPISGTSILFR